MYVQPDIASAQKRDAALASRIDQGDSEWPAFLAMGGFWVGVLAMYFSIRPLMGLGLLALVVGGLVLWGRDHDWFEPPEVSRRNLHWRLHHELPCPLTYPAGDLGCPLNEQSEPSVGSSN